MIADAPLPPGSTIGILGGGQLGRMLALAAARLGLRVHVLDPGEDPPAGQVAAVVTRADFEDAAALEAFAEMCDVVTFEFENVPAGAASVLAARTQVRPPPRALEVSQDRVVEKQFLNDLGIATASWAPVDDAAGLAAAVEDVGLPAVLKTRRFGYDGKGQLRLTEAADVSGAWEEIGAVPSILEGFVPFEAEISAIAARGADGKVAVYDPGLNRHRDGILDTTTVPCGVPARMVQDAVLTAGKILTALEYVGVIGVEYFVAQGRLLVNEIAPRVHNSGHWTMNACLIDQFEQHVRAVAGWPLGDATRHSDAVMTNLIGSDAEAWHALGGEQAGLHLYGKSEIRPGRKMGHVTRISPRSTG